MFDFLDTSPWWVLPVMIFFGRICDVTLGTLRIIFVSKGERYKAPIIGFFEVFIWIVIISQILTRANDLVAYLSYAAGYATGNYVGILIEQRIAFGIILYRIYTHKDGQELTKMLNRKGFGATVMHGKGAIMEVDIVEVVINRKSAKEVERIIEELDKDAFYVTEDVRSRAKGIFVKESSIFRHWGQGK